ncbi:hypothetical protein F4824DRAFT_481890 [Ustulina deusta]|nr:hypothetical protein F4824DRAFT_481890 [Ustulina deusta]
MKYTTSGLPDTDVHETQEKLDSLVNAPQSDGRTHRLWWCSHKGIFRLRLARARVQIRKRIFGQLIWHRVPLCFY